MKFSLLTLALGVTGSLASSHIAHERLHVRDGDSSSAAAASGTGSSQSSSTGTSTASASDSTSTGGGQQATYSKADVAITVKGNAFFRGKDRFYIRGM